MRRAVALCAGTHAHSLATEIQVNERVDQIGRHEAERQSRPQNRASQTVVLQIDPLDVFAAAPRALCQVDHDKIIVAEESTSDRETERASAQRPVPNRAEPNSGAPRAAPPKQRSGSALAPQMAGSRQH